MDMCMCFDGSCTLAAWHGERMGRVDWGCEGDGHAEMTGLCGEGAGTQCRWMEKGGAAGSSETESTYTPQRLRLALGNANGTASTASTHVFSARFTHERAL